MNYHFNVEIAKEHGVEVAIFLENVAFWTLKNIANSSHFKDGHYWIYNTQEAWSVLFPFWSRQNIRTIISKCVDKDLILRGNYNAKNYDKTIWYSLTDKCLTMFPTVKAAIDTLGWNQPRPVDNSDLSTDPWLESTNALVRINQAIPDNKPDHKQKSFCAVAQKKAKSEKPKTNWRQENGKRPDWADKMDIAAQTKNQMANEAKYIEQHEQIKRTPMPENLKALIRGLKMVN